MELKWEPDDGMKTGNDYRKLGGKMRELTRIIKIQTRYHYTSVLDVNDVGVYICMSILTYLGTFYNMRWSGLNAIFSLLDLLRLLGR